MANAEELSEQAMEAGRDFKEKADDIAALRPTS